MKSVFLGLSLAVASLPALRAAPTAPTAPSSSQAAPAPGLQKYLFVVDVSESMEGFEHGGRSALFNLIHSGVYGHMRLGDTFGLWPFNEGVFAGHYPMQRWDPEDTMNLAGNASRYLKNRNLSGKSRLEKVVPVILNVVTNVGDLNVFIISDGKSKIKGTPFDDEINKIYKRRASQASKAGQPLITLLLARHGELIRAGVTLAGEEIPMPPRPDPSNTEAPAIAGPARAKSITNAPAAKPSPAQGASTLVIKSNPPPNPTLPPAPPPTPSATNDPQAAGVVQTAPPPATSSPDGTSVPPFEALPSTPPDQEAPSSALVQAVSDRDPAVGANPATESGDAGKGIEAAPERAPSAAGQASGVSLLVDALVPDPIPIAAREVSSSGSAARTNGASSLPAVSALAVPGGAGAGSNLFLWAGLGLLFLVCAVLGVLAKCRHRPPGASFITRSMHRR